MASMAWPQQEPADQRGALPGAPGELGKTPTVGPQAMGEKLNISLDEMANAQFNLMRNSTPGLQEVVGCPGMTKADAEQRW